MIKISRHGAYGVVLRDSNILLTKKKGGPYQGLWDLPGGAIDFGETPEEALQRELLEEVALSAKGFEFFHVATANGLYEKQGEPYAFHHIGLIYKVNEFTPHEHRIPEEEGRWVALDEIDLSSLTPFAKEALSKLPKEGFWRPLSHIRGKVVGLALHEKRLLVCEVRDEAGTLKGWCPLGGGIDFGETTEAALKREIQEELGCAVEILGHPFICENLFEHQGQKGHELVFAFPIALHNPELYSKQRFRITEHSGSLHWVEWVALDRFLSKQDTLFPPALIGYFS